jgi:hypothetical protein
VHYFSRTATYRTSIDVNRGTGIEIKRDVGDRVFLTLIELHEIWTVKMNGTFAGTIWAMPYRSEVAGSLTDGHSNLELDATNLWPNRIIGYAQPSVSHSHLHEHKHPQARCPLASTDLRFDRPGYDRDGERDGPRSHAGYGRSSMKGLFRTGFAAMQSPFYLN